MSSFGFACVPRMSAPDCLHLARRGEELGYDTFWLPDQTFYYDPFTLLGAMAVATSRMELGVGVTNPFSRHPAQVARSAHAMADLAPGRFTLAMGAGNRKELLDKLSIPQEHVAPRTREAILAIRDLIEGQSVTRESHFFPMDRVALESPRTGKVPILVAARAPRMLQVSGETGDGAIVECLLSPESVCWARRLIRQGADRAGRSPEGFRYVAWGVGLLVEGFSQVPITVRNMAGHLIAAMPDEVIGLLGLDQEKMARMKVEYAVGGPPAAGPYVGEQELAAVTFVGTPEQVRHRFEALAEAGVDHISFLLLSKTAEEGVATLEAFAGGVLPSERTMP